MANALYPKAKQAFMSGALDLLSSDIRAVLVDLDEYTFDAADEFLSDIPNEARIAASPSLTGKEVTDLAAFKSDDAIFPAVTGAELEAVVLYAHTGTASTSRLILYLDDGITGAPLTPDGSDVRVIVDPDGWFTL